MKVQLTKLFAVSFLLVFLAPIAEAPSAADTEGCGPAAKLILNIAAATVQAGETVATTWANGWSRAMTAAEEADQKARKWTADVVASSMEVFAHTEKGARALKEEAVTHLEDAKQSTVDGFHRAVERVGFGAADTFRAVKAFFTCTDLAA